MSTAQAVGFRGIVRDITERVRTAQEKANLEAQLQRSQRMEAIGTLAGGIAHNFNNLLMGIQGNISLLMREHSPDSPHVKRLTTIEALVDGGSKLTSQLLGYARSGRVDVRVVDLNALVLEIAETFSLTRREYRVHTDLTASALPVEVDPAQIEQAVLNLLINAADAMPRGGDLYLGSRDRRRTPNLPTPSTRSRRGTTPSFRSGTPASGWTRTPSIGASSPSSPQRESAAAPVSVSPRPMASFGPTAD